MSGKTTEILLIQPQLDGTIKCKTVEGTIKWIRKSQVYIWGWGVGKK